MLPGATRLLSSETSSLPQFRTEPLFDTSLSAWGDVVARAEEGEEIVYAEVHVCSLRDSFTAPSRSLTLSLGRCGERQQCEGDDSHLDAEEG